jgi:hypothetical protein
MQRQGLARGWLGAWALSLDVIHVPQSDRPIQEHKID